MRGSIATTLLALDADTHPRVLGARSPQIALTHQQIAALAGTSRDTCTKVLHDFVDQHLIRLARCRITVLGPERLADHAG